MIKELSVIGNVIKLNIRDSLPSRIDLIRNTLQDIASQKVIDAVYTRERVNIIYEMLEAVKGRGFAEHNLSAQIMALNPPLITQSMAATLMKNYESGEIITKAGELTYKELVEKYKAQEVLLRTALQAALISFNQLYHDTTEFLEAAYQPVANLAAEIKQIIGSMQAEAELGDYKLELIDNLEDALGIDISKYNLAHALAELIRNAIKYGAPGTVITIILDHIPPTDIPERVILGVHNYGIGIPESEIHSISNEGYRATNVQEIPGTGNGLSHIKEIVGKAGGTMFVRSEDGHFAMIELTLPVVLPEA